MDRNGKSDATGEKMYAIRHLKLTDVELLALFCVGASSGCAQLCQALLQRFEAHSAALLSL